MKPPATPSNRGIEARASAQRVMEGANRAKRLKSSEDGVAVEEFTELRARRIAELEAEIAQLRHGRPPEGVQQLERNHEVLPEVAEMRGRVEELQRRNAELESKIEQLRQPGRRQEEVGHEVLPAVVEVVVTTKVDLSRIDTGLVTHISSFLASSRELLSIALTCKSFGWRQPTSTLNWSLVEEVARQSVCSRATDNEMACLPRYVSGTATWLLILHRHEHLLEFDVLLGGHIAHRNGDKTTVCGTGENDFSGNVAVSSGYVMRTGAHYAEFRIAGAPYIGVVRPMPGLDAGAYPEGFSFFDDGLYPDFLAQRSAEWGNDNVHVCEYCCADGEFGWTDWVRAEYEWEQWEGMEPCRSGDTVGMLLNLDEGTLTVYKNNRRLGVMKDGLSGLFCWYANVTGVAPTPDGNTVSISNVRLQATANSSPN